MEQIIQAAFSGGAQGKSAVGSTGLLNMTGVSSDKVKAAGTQSGNDQEDSTALVPFIQLLHRQMSQTNESSDDNESYVVRERENLTLPGEVTLKELQQVLANAVQSGETAGLDQGQNVQTGDSFGDLLKEMDSLKNNPSLENIRTDSDAGSEMMTSRLENETMEAISNSENELKKVNDQNVLLSPSYGIALEEGENKFISETDLKNVNGTKSDNIYIQSHQKDESLQTAQAKIAETDLKNISGARSDEAEADNVSFQSLPGNGTADGEAKFKIQGMEKQSLLKTDEKTLQLENVVNKETQLAENGADKITVSLNKIKEENKIDKAITSDEAMQEDHVIRSNASLSMKETKESLANKDNLRFVQEQYQNTADANTGNKAQSDTMQAIMGEVTGKIKAEQNGKVISGAKGKEDISLTGFNAAASGQAGLEKTSDVLPDKIIAQVTNEVKEAAANDGGRVKITLNPPSLGKVEMDVTVRNGKVEVIMVADNKDVQQTLNTHIDKLKGGLQNQGLTIDRCDVFMQDKREEYQQSFNQQAFYQDRGSGREGNGRRENSEKEVKVGAIISEKPGSVLRVSTDNISLFA